MVDPVNNGDSGLVARTKINDNDTSNAKKFYSFGAGNASASVADRYLFPANGDNVTAQTTRIQFTVPFDLTVNSMYLDQAGNGNGNDIIYTLEKNATPETDLQITVASTANAGSDTGSVSFVAGDKMSLAVTKPLSIGTSPSDIIIIIGYEAD